MERSQIEVSTQMRQLLMELQFKEEFWEENNLKKPRISF
jgi:predicted ATPase